MDQIELTRALQLDLDGTIADTLPLIFEAYRHDDVTRPKPDQEGLFNVSEVQEDGRSACRTRC